MIKKLVIYSLTSETLEFVQKTGFFVETTLRRHQEHVFVMRLVTNIFHRFGNFRENSSFHMIGIRLTRAPEPFVNTESEQNAK